MYSGTTSNVLSLCVSSCEKIIVENRERQVRRNDLAKYETIPQLRRRLSEKHCRQYETFCPVAKEKGVDLGFHARCHRPRIDGSLSPLVASPAAG
jgi:hypothetical protein